MGKEALYMYSTIQRHVISHASQLIRQGPQRLRVHEVMAGHVLRLLDEVPCNMIGEPIE